jgi:hypothetical protein
MIRFDSFFSIRITGFQNFWCPLRPLCFHFINTFHRVFLFHTSVFPGSAQADLVLFADAVSTARLRIPYKCSPPTTNRQQPTAHHLGDSFRFVFFNSIHWLQKFYVSFAPFIFFISSLLSIVFFFSPGRRRPTLCSSQLRFQPPGYGSYLSLVVFFSPPPSFLGRRRPTLCSSQLRFQPPITRSPN